MKNYYLWGWRIALLVLFLTTIIMISWAQCSVSSPNGSLDYANCNGVGGWAFDGANLNQPITIDIYVDGVKTYSGITANGDRQDLVTAFGNSAARYHGFSYSFPATAAWKNGQNHAISVRICEAANAIGGSPKTVSGCTGGTQPPTTGSCPYTEGQFLFTTSWGESVYAHFYNGTLFAAYQDGSNFRPQHWLVATGQMSTSTASCFAENDPHTTTTTPPTTTTTTTTIPPAGSNFAGNLDGVDCNGIGGWVMNRNATNQSTKFDVYINGQLAASNVLASNSRQDVSNAFGISGYNAFGFSWSIPAQYKNGSALNISVKYAGTNTDIPGSPKTTAACQGTGTTPTTPTTNPTTSQIPPAGSNFAGNLDGVDCNSIGGWVLNRNMPNQSTKVDIYVNGWLAAPNILANNSRQDVANAYGISGYNAFGFQIILPTSYKVGVSLTISVKYAGTKTDIPGSPKTTVVCGTGASAGTISVNNFDPECNTGIARVFPGSEQTIYNGIAHTGTVSLKLSANSLGRSSSLTSRLIPVKQGDRLSFDAYAFTSVLTKGNLIPQLTMAAVGGVMAGLALTQHQTTSSDQGRTIQKVPTIGVSTALAIPLVKSLLANRLPKATLELAFYNKSGYFVHRQQVNITKAAREGWELMHINGQAPQDGYAVIRLQNHSQTPVYFDDLSLQTKPNLDLDFFREERPSPK
ncbi:hypothetical protein GO730_27425 [Spirosoma sp. HMF3257]|uniref:Uncharacterized protein n=1 Tax=Spirosoma telluris TaxID=2183553 RepID=A0A327NT24_9BACT|nr:hypothetical protein [Spirosoma telluris]RAI76964.1 hypothetical protein HMF3257_27345 [Spirosoma telluris]